MTGEKIIMTDDNNPEAMAACYAAGFCRSSRRIYQREAERVGFITRQFQGSDIVSFEEFKYFSNCVISNSLFSECSSLVSVILPNHLTSLETYAFYRCTSLRNVVLPSALINLGSQSFYLCSSLQDIDIPNGVTVIGDFCFRSCTSISELDMPPSVTTIGAMAFLDCTALRRIDGLQNVTSIGRSAFEGCILLESIELPNGITTIYGATFQDCKSITSIEIPASVTNIKDFAFAYMGNLSEIVMTSSSAPQIEDTTFVSSGSGVSGVRKLKVPSGSSGYDSGAWLDLQTRITAPFVLEYY